MRAKTEAHLLGLLERGLRFARLALYGGVAALVAGGGVPGLLADPTRVLLSAFVVGLLYALEPPSARPRRR